MNNLDLKQKIMIVVGIIGALLILIFQRGLYSKSDPVSMDSSKPDVKSEAKAGGQPQLISTNPSPLEEAIIWAKQPIEITFNQPLENIPEFKYRIEPKTEMEAKLSNDNKTITLTPKDPLKLGSVFTLFISPETKFASQSKETTKKTLDKEYIFHFRTVEYKGV